MLVDALGVDEEEIKPESVIRDDLGAESIDFLDIGWTGILIFQAEQSQHRCSNVSRLLKRRGETLSGDQDIPAMKYYRCAQSRMIRRL